MRTVAASKLGQNALICVQCNLITLQVMKIRMSLILMKAIKRINGFIICNLTFVIINTKLQLSYSINLQTLTTFQI